MEWFRMRSLYADDLAIHRVGERGELLFLRGIAWSAAADTDGFIPETQPIRFGLAALPQRISALVREGLWQEVDGGWQIRSWGAHQSAEYSAERKRRRDANRIAAKRSVARQSRDESQSVAHLEVEEELTPLPPAPQGGSCDGQHDNCRGCKTTRRQRERAEKVWKPPWCGRCDQRTRQVDVDSDAPGGRCPDCHPLAASA